MSALVSKNIPFITKVPERLSIWLFKREIEVLKNSYVDSDLTSLVIEV